LKTTENRLSKKSCPRFPLRGHLFLQRVINIMTGKPEIMLSGFHQSVQYVNL
jgi:hypothetical protein